MKILKLNEWLNKNSIIQTNNKLLKESKVSITDNNITEDLIDSIINLIGEGTYEKILFTNSNIRVPVTHETFFMLFPDLSQKTLDRIEREMKEYGITWKYPHNEDAANDHSRNDWKTYDWDLDELNNAGLDLSDFNN